MIERNFVFNPPRNVNHGTLPTWLAGIAQFLIVRRAAKRSITLRETPLWWQDDGLLNWVKENDCEAIGQAIGRPDMVATHVIAVGCAGVFVPMLGSRDELALDPRLVPQTKHQESPYPDRFTQAIRKEMEKSVWTLAYLHRDGKLLLILNVCGTNEAIRRNLPRDANRLHLRLRPSGADCTDAPGWFFRWCPY
jgi:hypothetical protein